MDARFLRQRGMIVLPTQELFNEQEENVSAETE